jgi:hypothetical protein
MFLRSTTRLKDGKMHYYWSIVENRRCRGDRVVSKRFCIWERLMTASESSGSGPLRFSMRMQVQWTNLNSLLQSVDFTIR